MLVDFDARDMRGWAFFTGGSDIMDYGLIFCPEPTLKLKHLDRFVSHKQTAFHFFRHYLMDWSGVDYCDVLLAVWTHSDGTHSLQSIHSWASDAMLHLTKSVLMRLSKISADFHSWVNYSFKLNDISFHPVWPAGCEGSRAGGHDGSGEGGGTEVIWAGRGSFWVIYSLNQLSHTVWYMIHHSLFFIVWKYICKGSLSGQCSSGLGSLYCCFKALASNIEIWITAVVKSRLDCFSKQIYFCYALPV